MTPSDVGGRAAPPARGGARPGARVLWRRPGGAWALVGALAAAQAMAQTVAQTGPPDPAAGFGALGVVAYRIVDARAIPDPLGGLEGRAAEGRALYADPPLGCAVCHGPLDGPAGSGAAAVQAPGGAAAGQGPGPGDGATAGAAGVQGGAGGRGEAPSLAGVAARLDPGALRLWLVAPGVIAPGATMPGYYLAGQRAGAADPLVGGPRLTAQQIEDLVAYLATQTGG